jgi:3-deoxy-manno-octulosonate cytidylyltransferase (CMP-KDO synthetase)
MKVAVVIPSRMAASRFPGKPLAKISGIPLVTHVYHRSVLAVGAESVWVATCDREIADAIAAVGGRAIMTSDKHERCTDRIAEAARQIKADVVVNIQGDEPVLNPDDISLVLSAFSKDKNCVASNLIQKLDAAQEDPANYNSVKVVFDRNMRALYFSREAIPTPQRTKVPRQYYKQTGIMAFRADFLQTFSNLEPTPLEKAESVDMMRMLEHGYPLQLIETRSRLVSVDVPSDVALAEAALASDPHFSKYSTSRPGTSA